MSHLTTKEPLAFPINSEPTLFCCQACNRKVTREHINVWERRAHDHIRAKNTRSAQLCDKCKPVPEPLTPAILDGYGPIDHDLERAAILIHGVRCRDTGSEQGWLEARKVYRNTIRRGVEALAQDVPEGDA
jgi:hypothetical protein